MKNIFLSAIIALFIGVSASAQSTVDSIAAKYKLLPMPAPLTIEKTFPVLGTYQLSTDAAVSNTTTATTATSSTTAATTTTATADQTATTSTEVNALATPAITITLDSASKGIVWVDGLPEGKFKAYLKKSPTTYRILSQKTNLGKQIPEGTLYFDVETNALHIAMGKAYNEEDPIGIFAINAPEVSADVAATTKSKTAKSKSKSKVTFYTASKLVTDPAAVEEAQGGGAIKQDQQ